MILIGAGGAGGAVPPNELYTGIVTSEELFEIKSPRFASESFTRGLFWPATNCAAKGNVEALPQLAASVEKQSCPEPGGPAPWIRQLLPELVIEEYRDPQPESKTKVLVFPQASGSGLQAAMFCS
jgi:hypothetical protein